MLSTLCDICGIDNGLDQVCLVKSRRDGMKSLEEEFLDC